MLDCGLLGYPLGVTSCDPSIILPLPLSFGPVRKGALPIGRRWTRLALSLLLTVGGMWGKATSYWFDNWTSEFSFDGLAVDGYATEKLRDFWAGEAWDFDVLLPTIGPEPCGSFDRAYPYYH